MCYKLENIENFQKLNVKKPEMTKIIETIDILGGLN